MFRGKGLRQIDLSKKEALATLLGVHARIARRWVGQGDRGAGGDSVQ